ncbi:putative hydrolase, partial [Gordonia effusa NBRC 100432]
MTYQLDTPGQRATARKARRTSVPTAQRGSIQALPLGDPTGGANAREWRKLVDGKQRYPRVSINRSAIITMSDGVRLRATVVRPANRFGQAITTPYPVIVNINPYNRAVIGGIDKTLHAPVIGHAISSAS